MKQRPAVVVLEDAVHSEFGNWTMLKREKVSARQNTVAVRVRYSGAVLGWRAVELVVRAREAEDRQSRVATRIIIPSQQESLPGSELEPCRTASYRPDLAVLRGKNLPVNLTACSQHQLVLDIWIHIELRDKTWATENMHCL